MKTRRAVRILTCAAGMLLASSASLASEPAANTAPSRDTALAERLGADEHGMRRYVLVILKSGPTPIQDPDARKTMFAGHFANMERLSAEGKLALAGPFAKNEDGWRGLFLLAVETIDAARALTETDPVIINGEMVAEYHPWFGSAAAMMIPEIHSKLAPTAD